MLALTGGTGFIGSVMARRLRQSGYTIRALVRSPRKAHTLTSLGIEVVVGELGESRAVRRLLRGTAAVVHCAGAVRGFGWVDFARVNAHGVARLARTAVMQEKPPRFILLSSLAARAPELSQYAASKRSGEDMLRLVAGQRMEWVALRPPAVYGPGDRELLPLLRCMAYGIGPEMGPAEARFSMLYVEDLAAGVEACLKAAKPMRAVFELHDGRENGYSWGEAREIVAAAYNRHGLALRIPRTVLGFAGQMSVLWSSVSGRAPMLSPGKVRELTHSNWVCDNAALTDATGWRPRVELSEGIQRTLRGSTKLMREF